MTTATRPADQAVTARPADREQRFDALFWQGLAEQHARMCDGGDGCRHYDTESEE